VGPGISRALIGLAGMAACAAAACGATARLDPRTAPIVREDSTVRLASDQLIAIRRVAVAGVKGEPVLLVHGAGGGGVASFDLPVPGYSLAEDLARAGHPTYVVDLPGWGASTRPAAMDEPPEGKPPLARSEEMVSDLRAVVEWIRDHHQVEKIAIVGWATGGHWAGMFAAQHPDQVGHLVMINALYGTPGPWSLRAALADPAQPSQPAALGAYALRDGANLVGRWEATIPGADKAAWRDPRVAEAYVASTLSADPTSAARQPPSVRVPTGPLYDSFLLANGDRMWDAAAITAAVLVVRASLDFWSRPEDVAALRTELSRAAEVQIVEIKGATHFVHLDRPEHGRQRLVDALVGFLDARP
jgi:pimeloyl-ACP methyl ester carboxylesterase